MLHEIIDKNVIVSHLLVQNKCSSTHRKKYKNLCPLAAKNLKFTRSFKIKISNHLPVTKIFSYYRSLPYLSRRFNLCTNLP